MFVTSVTRPLLGPPHTHTAGTQGLGVELVQSVLMGDVTPETDPHRYNKCVSHICDFMLREVRVCVPICVWLYIDIYI